MKIVKVKPFGVFKLTEQVIESVENNSIPAHDENTFKKLIMGIKKNGSAHFIGVLPEKKEMFSFIPIIEDCQLFASEFPDPIQLYFSLAYSNYQFANQTRENIILQKDQGSKLNFINSYLYNWHLQYKISTIIFLHSTVEAFINYSMPEEFIYKQEYSPNNSDKFIRQFKEFNKEQTERYILFKEKMSDVIKQITGIDFLVNHKKVYDNLVNLNTLRNDIIHLRSTKSKNSEYFHQVFDQVINIELSPFVDSVGDFINIVKPGFIEFDDFNSNDSAFEFNFETHAAFKLDISVFLKILEVKSQKVNLNIPKSSDDTFQTSFNWIMQNLDIMAKQQLIYFPKIDSSPNDKIIIEITKREK